MPRETAGHFPFHRTRSERRERRLGLREIAQHIVQHAAIFEIFNLNSRIDPRLQLDGFHRAVLERDRARYERERG